MFLSVEILVGKRDTNKRFLWICFPRHLKKYNNGTRKLIFIDVFIYPNLIEFGSERSKQLFYLHIAAYSFVQELLDLNIIFKEAADCFRAHIALNR